MADTGWVNCGTGANDASIGSEAWTSPGNITASDNSRAETGGVSWTINEVTNALKGTNYGFAIPAGATIDGIEMRAELSESFISGDPKTFRASLVKAGSIQATDRETGEQALSTSDAFFAYGGAADLWADTWTPADINASNFGCIIQCVKRGGSTAAARCDSLQMRITYTPAAGSGRKAQMTQVIVG